MDFLLLGTLRTERTKVIIPALISLFCQMWRVFVFLSLYLAVVNCFEGSGDGSGAFPLYYLGPSWKGKERSELYFASGSASGWDLESGEEDAGRVSSMRAWTRKDVSIYVMSTHSTQ